MEVSFIDYISTMRLTVQKTNGRATIGNADTGFFFSPCGAEHE